MTTLTEFLLARIAEDEAEAQSWDLPKSRRPRALAECEAKRRIVEWHSGTEEECCEGRWGPLVLDAEPELSAGTDPMGQLTIRQSVGVQPWLGCVTLMMLALPYADHEASREEWRP